MGVWTALTRRSALFYFPFLLLALVTLALTAWAARTLWHFPYDGLQWSADGEQIIFLDPQGPTAQAGIQTGDRVLQIDGVPLDSRVPRYSGKQIGDQVIMTILRANNPARTTFTLATPPLRELVGRLEPLLVGLAFWGVGLVVWALHPFHGVTRSFFLVSQVTTGMLAIGDLSGIRLPWATHLFSVSLLLLAPLTLHFFASFPVPIPARPRRLILGLTYGGAAFLALLTLASILLLKDSEEPSVLWVIRRSFVAVTLIGALALLLRPRQTASLQVRRQHRLLVAGMIASVSPLLIFSFMPELLQGTPLIDYIWTFPFLILLPVTYAYAVRSGELGRIDLFLNRSMVYLVLTALLLGLYVSFFVVWERVMTAARWSRPIVGAVLAVMVAALYSTMRDRLRQWMDRLFYGGWYDYRNLVQAASAKLSQTQDPTQLARRLTSAVNTMRFQSAALLWPDASVLTPKGSFGYGSEVLELLQLPVEGALTQYLWAQPSLCWQEQLCHQLTSAKLTQAERTLLEADHVHFWLPLTSHDTLYGVLVMGDRLGDEPLDQEDLDILITLAEQAVLAAENVALLETLRARLTEMGQIRDELSETQRRLAENQERERIHLAQELHDGPVQDLYSARFQLQLLAETLPIDSAMTQHESALTQLVEVQAALREVTDSLRLICRELRPPTLAPFGFEMAVRSYVERFREKHPQLDIQVDLTHDGKTLPESVRLALFRIFQQALNNVVRHADAGCVLIRFSLDTDQMVLEVQDDGRGFVVPERWIELARQGHFGLLGAAERAEAIGGRLEIISAPGEGALVRVIAPCPNSE